MSTTVPCIYLIYAEVDEVRQWKIGASKRDPQHRLLEMMTANPNIKHVEARYETTVELMWKIEAVLKRWYKQYKIKGEWIAFDALNKQEFLQRCKTIENNFKIINNNNFIL